MNTDFDTSIRQANASDLDLLFSICRQAYSENFYHHWNEGGLEWYLEKVYSREGIWNDLTNPELLYFVAFVDDAPAGFMKLKLNSKLDEQHESGIEVDKIYFRPQFQGKGIGRMLIIEAINLGKKIGRKIIWLGVIDTNTEAKSFYQKLGFKEYDKARLELPYFREELKGMWRMMRPL